MAISIFSQRVLLPTWEIVPAVLTTDGPLISKLEKVDRCPEGVMDLGDQLVVPAFINCHTHLPMAFLRGIEGTATALHGDVVKDLYFRLENLLTPADVRSFTRMGCYESLLAGVGLVWEHYYHGQALADALADTGLCGVVAPTLQDLEGPGMKLTDAALADTAGIARSDGAKARGIFAALGPHATDTVSDELWGKIVAVAKEHNLPIHSHVAQSIAEYRSIGARAGGKTPVEMLKSLGVLDAGVPMMLVHGQYMTMSDLDLLKPDHMLCFCPRSHMLFAFPAPIHRWVDAGRPFAVATDAAASNDDMNVQPDLRVVQGLAMTEVTVSKPAAAFYTHTTTDPAQRLAAAEALHSQRQQVHSEKAVEKLRDPRRLLDMVWKHPGGLHPAFRAGELSEGALANVLILDPRHPALWPGDDLLRALVMCEVAPAITGMIAGGRWIGREGAAADGGWQQSVLGAEYREAQEDASVRRRALLRRAGIGSANL